MKLYKTILFICLVTISTHQLMAQLTYDKWETVDIVDEFGDKTGESVKRIFHKGTFSNSAAYKKDLIVKVVDYGDNMSISLFEYNKPPSARLAYESSFGNISVKMADGSVQQFKVFAPKSGGIFIDTKDSLYKLMKNGNNQELKVSIKQSSFSDIGQSTYVFNLLTQ